MFIFRIYTSEEEKIETYILDMSQHVPTILNINITKIFKYQWYEKILYNPKQKKIISVYLWHLLDKHKIYLVSKEVTKGAKIESDSPSHYWVEFFE